MISFYLSWFSRVYQQSDSGWIVARTPDGKPVCEQDAYFWFALEIIGHELNAMRAEQMAAMQNG